MGAAQRQHPQGLKPEAGIAAGQKIRPRRCLALRMDGETNGTLLHRRLILQGWSQQGWAGPDRGQVWPPISVTDVETPALKPRRA